MEWSGKGKEKMKNSRLRIYRLRLFFFVLFFFKTPSLGHGIEDCETLKVGTNSMKNWNDELI